jgi:uncharacterized protein (DUF2384 family)
MTPEAVPRETLMITENIRSMMEVRDLKGAAVADRIGMPHATWYRRLREPSNFTIGELDRLAEVFRVPRSAITG